MSDSNVQGTPHKAFSGRPKLTSARSLLPKKVCFTLYTYSRPLDLQAKKDVLVSLHIGVELRRAWAVSYTTSRPNDVELRCPLVVHFRRDYDVSWMRWTSLRHLIGTSVWRPMCDVFFVCKSNERLYHDWLEIYLLGSSDSDQHIINVWKW